MTDVVKFLCHALKKANLLNNNKLIWILSGQLYNSPTNSFINFYSDYKLTRHNSIFRTKVINHYDGYVYFVNNKQNLYERLIQITNKKYSYQSQHYNN